MRIFAPSYENAKGRETFTWTAYLLEFNIEELLCFPLRLTSKNHMPNEICSELTDDGFVQIIPSISTLEAPDFCCESPDCRVIGLISDVDVFMHTDECPYPLDEACPTVDSHGGVLT